MKVWVFVHDNEDCPVVELYATREGALKAAIEAVQDIYQDPADPLIRELNDLPLEGGMVIYDEDEGLSVAIQEQEVNQ